MTNKKKKKFDDLTKENEIFEKKFLTVDFQLHRAKCIKMHQMKSSFEGMVDVVTQKVIFRKGEQNRI